jgi:ferredoxin
LSLTKKDIDKYKKAYPELLSPEKCTECGICEKACPIEAIRLLK